MHRLVSYPLQAAEASCVITCSLAATSDPEMAQALPHTRQHMVLPHAFLVLQVLLMLAKGSSLSSIFFLEDKKSWISSSQSTVVASE